MLYQLHYTREVLLVTLHWQTVQHTTWRWPLFRQYAGHHEEPDHHN
jgi:hypothetical protein